MILKGLINPLERGDAESPHLLELKYRLGEEFKKCHLSPKNGTPKQRNKEIRTGRLNAESYMMAAKACRRTLVKQ